MRAAKWMAILVVIATVSACGRPFTRGELTYQILHAADMAQTAHGASLDCFVEYHPVTRRIIGKSPTPEGVVAYWAVTAAGHKIIGDFLLDRGYRKTYAVFQAISITDTTAAIAFSYSNGARPLFTTKKLCR